MAALASCLLLSASCAALVGAATLPPGFPCANATPTILSSVQSTSWPGACLGLKDMSSAATKTAASCKALCIADQTCSVWQLGPAVDGSQCWISGDNSIATDCWGRGNESYVPQAAERIQHGFVNVTQELAAGSFIPGLEEVGDFKSTTDAGGMHRCKAQCYSILACGKWLYVTGTSTVVGAAGQSKGCWLQSWNSALGALTMLPAGQTSVGEAIDHTCVPPPPAPPAKEESNLWKILVLVAIIVILIIVVLVVIFFVCCQKEKGPKKTRAVKVAPKREPQVLQPLVRMPVVQQPMVQYAAPTVTTAMVTPTYQAVPQAAPAVYASAPMFQSIAVAPTVMTQPMLM